MIATATNKTNINFNNLPAIQFQLLQSLIKVTDPDSSRYVLGAIRLTKNEEGKMTATATDGRRLHRVAFNANYPEDWPEQVLLCANDLRKARVQKTATGIRLYATKSKTTLSWTFKGQQYKTNISSPKGRYPTNVEEMIDHTKNCADLILEFRPENMLEAIREPYIPEVRLKFDHSGVGEIKRPTTMFKFDVVQGNLHEFEWNANPEYLQDWLESFPASNDKVKAYIPNDPGAPWCFEIKRTHYNVQALIMPLTKQ